MDLPGKYKRSKFDLTSKNMGVIPEEFVRCHDDSTAKVFTCFGTGEGPTGAQNTLQSTQKPIPIKKIKNNPEWTDVAHFIL